MSAPAKTTYKAQIETQRIRDELELGVDDSDPFEVAFEHMTDMEKIVFVLFEYQLSPRFIYTHLGISRQRLQQLKQQIGVKLLQFREDDSEI
jgi:hypothetical protein